MIKRVPGTFVSGDVIAYIPRMNGGFYPILFDDDILYICDSRLRKHTIASAKFQGEILSWEYHCSIEDEDVTYLPRKPITSEFGYGTIVLLVNRDGVNWLVGYKLPPSNSLSKATGEIVIEKKFEVETSCNLIIGMTPASTPSCPDLTLQDINKMVIHHHSVVDGRLLSEQKFKQITVFPTHVRCNKRQVGFDGSHLLALTTNSGKYDFLWPIETLRENPESSFWQLEWDERSGLVNLFDGYNYSIIDVSKKEIITTKNIGGIGYGLNSTMYEGAGGGVFWIRRYIDNHDRKVSINRIGEGQYEAIDFIRSTNLGDMFLFGFDEGAKYSVTLFIPDATINEIKQLEFTGLAEPIFQSEFIEETGELHLFSENNHYVTAPLEKLV